MKAKQARSPWRRPILATIAALAFGGPAAASGCGASFTPISQIDGMRVLAVEADKPYASPGDTVTFQMSYYDGYVDPENPNGATRPVQIVWLGGCFDPEGDQYFQCYSQIAPLLQGLNPNGPLPDFVGFGDTFSLKLPEDIVTRRPQPPSGTPWYGIAYVFFAVCAGRLGPVPAEGSGAAGSFPLGCFDSDNNRLGAESFVPGYTQVYVFADGRTNANPTITGMTIEKKTIEPGLDKAAEIEACDVPDDQRLGPYGCGKEDPAKTCGDFEIEVVVPEDVAETDPDAKNSDGTYLKEVVWVDYFADRGNLDTPTTLVSDATTGYIKKHSTKYVAPAEPGPVNVWAVVHDSRGGQSIIQRYLRVKGAEAP